MRTIRSGRSTRRRTDRNSRGVNTGEVVWKVPLGVVDDLAAQGITHTGTPNVGGPIATSPGLVFIGARRDKRAGAAGLALLAALFAGEIALCGLLLQWHSR